MSSLLIVLNALPEHERIRLAIRWTKRAITRVGLSPKYLAVVQALKDGHDDPQEVLREAIAAEPPLSPHRPVAEIVALQTLGTAVYFVRAPNAENLCDIARLARRVTGWAATKEISTVINDVGSHAMAREEQRQISEAQYAVRALYTLPSGRRPRPLLRITRWDLL